MVPLPADFRDRPRWQRWMANIQLLLGLRSIKATCCESFRKEGKMRACKGCPTLYNVESPRQTYQFIARRALRRTLPTLTNDSK